jgi:hypothetical protein
MSYLSIVLNSSLENLLSDAHSSTPCYRSFIVVGGKRKPSAVHKLASNKRSSDAETEGSLRKSKQRKIEMDLTSPLCAHCQLFNLDLKFEMAIASYQRLADGLTSFLEGIYETLDRSYFYNDAVCIHVFEG